MLRNVTSCAWLVVLCGAAFAQSGPTVEELISKSVAARGGVDKIKAIDSLKISGKGVAMNGIEVPVTVYMKRPGMMRSEVKIQDKLIVQAFDGTDAWSINPLTGGDAPQKADEEMSKRMRDNAQSMMDGYLTNYKAKGYQVELVGKEDVESSPAYKLKITTKDGSIVYDYLDAKTYLEVRSTAKTKQMGQEIEVDSYSSDYKPVNGVMLPYTVDQRVNGMSMMKMVFEKTEANVPMEGSIFQFPVAGDGKPEEKK